MNHFFLVRFVVGTLDVMAVNPSYWLHQLRVLKAQTLNRPAPLSNLPRLPADIVQTPGTTVIAPRSPSSAIRPETESTHAPFCLAPP